VHFSASVRAGVELACCSLPARVSELKAVQGWEVLSMPQARESRPIRAGTVSSLE